MVLTKQQAKIAHVIRADQVSTACMALRKPMPSHQTRCLQTQHKVCACFPQNDRHITYNSHKTSAIQANTNCHGSGDSQQCGLLQSFHNLYTTTAIKSDSSSHGAAHHDHRQPGRHYFSQFLSSTLVVQHSSLHRGTQDQLGPEASQPIFQRM